MQNALNTLTEAARGRRITPERIDVEWDAELIRVRVTSPECPSPVQDDVSGKLGKYRILEKIGEGGMGRVYAAWDPSLRRKVALKILSSPAAGDKVKARFEQEVQSLAVLSHPNVVTIHDFCTEGDTSFAVMEYLDGSTLRDMLDEGPLPLGDCLRIGRQIAEGLAAAHDQDIVHRDVKPENIVVTKEGRVKLLDFGLSTHISRADRTNGADDSVVSRERGRIVGTVGYMSPEQARADELDFRSDVFSFGIVLYEMLTGEHPFSRRTGSQTLRAIMTDPPAVARGDQGSVRLMQIVGRCLCKAPRNRFASMSLLAQLLRELHREQQI